MNTSFRDVIRNSVVITSDSNISISREMIEHQNNDYVVGTLNDLFQDLINNVKASKTKKASSLHKDNYTLDILNKIDYTIKERFGIETKLVAMDDSDNFGVYISSPREVDTIQETMFNEVMSEFKSIIEKYKVNNTNTKAKNQVQELDMSDIKGKDNLSFVYNYRKSINALKEKMRTSSVIIDRKKAKIIGLPTDYIAYISHDLPSFIRKMNCNAQELTAVLLHEIGHAFTYIEYSYRSVTNTSVLMDTFLDNIEKKNRSPKESLVLAYERVSSDKSTDYKTKDATTATIYMLDSYLKENRFNVTGSAHAGTDAEQLADQFASRFGVGEHLISALDKFRESVNNQIFGYRAQSLFYGIVVCGGLAVLWLCMGSWMGWYLLFIGAIFTLSAVLIDNPIEREGDPGYVTTYDDAKRRYKRIRNDYIRRLRSNPSATKAEIESTINALDKVDRLIAAVPDAKIGIIDQIYRMCSSNAKHRLDVRNIERMIEDLSENSLYLAAAKLKSKI